MLNTFPAAWLLFALPFVSSAVIENVGALTRLSTRHNRITRAIGIIGIGVLFGGLLGAVPLFEAVPVMLGAGLVSGFAMFLAPRSNGGGDDGDDWRGGGPPPDDPPPPPGGDPIDWDRFDRLRSRWERVPAGTGSR